MNLKVSAVLAIVIIIGLVVYCNRGTDPEIQKKVDKQYFGLRTNLLEISEPDETNFQEIAAQLDSVRWTPIEDGGKYEKKNKELFLKEKRKIAEKIKEIYDDISKNR